MRSLVPFLLPLLSSACSLTDIAGICQAEITGVHSFTCLHNWQLKCMIVFDCEFGPIGKVPSAWLGWFTFLQYIIFFLQ